MMLCAAARAGLIASLPLAFAVTPSPRWGHQAVYVSSQQAMYIVGGEVEAEGTQVTNDVLVLPLNNTNPSFSMGASNALPPHAFAAMSLTKDESSIVIVGGMTSSCSSDGLAHTFDLSGTGTWSDVTPSSVVRRRGAGMAWVDNGSTNGEMMLVGGVADEFSCASSAASYPAADVLSLPMSSSSLVSSRALPPSLTGSDLAVSDFVLAASSAGTVYLAGGQSANGDLVSFGSIGVWNTTAGWTTQTTTGDVPTGRTGATLVSHPFLDLLVLHGGSVLSNATNTDTPSTLLAFLNTTTLAWSTPSNLQPPASSAVSYHSSIMTTSGVMITAFGLGSSGSARSDVLYLDMRDPTGLSWTWKSYWNSNMLDASTSTSETATTSTNGVAASNDTDSSAPSSKKVTTITVPVIAGLLLALPLVIYFIRRRVRIARKRRMARHFSFSSQEDSGDFSTPVDGFRTSRRTKTQYPFGRDANEKDWNVISEIGTGLVSILKRYSGTALSGSNASSSRDKSSKGGKISEKAMKWEEIDFGLGKLDERHGSFASRRSSFSAPSLSPPAVDEAHVPLPFAMPVASTVQGFDPNTLSSVFQGNNASRPVSPLNDVGTPRHDGQIPLVPSVVVMSPTRAQNQMNSMPTASADGLDWNMLQRDLEVRPVFRSISPTSTLRSHAHTISPAPLELRRASSPTVNPKTGRRSMSPVPLPFAGRQIAGNRDRRGSAPYSPSSSGSVTPTGPADLPMRRVSNPFIGLIPGSPMQASKREIVQSRLRVVNVTDNEEAGQAV